MSTDFNAGSPETQITLIGVGKEQLRILKEIPRTVRENSARRPNLCEKAVVLIKSFFDMNSKH